MNESILVIDDNSDNLDLTQILLEAEGFEVRLAEDAEKALETLETYRPELILMDIQLPGIDGLELTRRLRRKPAFQDVIIVALSAYAMKGDEDMARAVGCDGYITKPINTRTFAGAVRGYLQALRPTPSDCDLREARATYQGDRASDHDPTQPILVVDDEAPSSGPQKCTYLIALDSRCAHGFSGTQERME